MKGMIVSVFRSALGDCTNGGASATHNELLVVGPGIPGIFEANGRPVFCLAEGVRRFPEAVRLMPVDPCPPGKAGPMFGGNFAYFSDDRWCNAVEAMGGNGFQAVKIFDRYE